MARGRRPASWTCNADWPMDPARFTRVDPTTWRVEPHGAMRVPAVIYADENLIRDMDDKVFEQAVNVATLPGIVQASYAMPDAHWGYGFPIGGVAAFDPDRGGVVSAGGVGFDISCGVRTMLTGLSVVRHSSGAEGACRIAVSSDPGRRRQHGRDHARCRSTWTRCFRAARAGRSSAAGANHATSNGSRKRDAWLEREPECVSERAKERQRREMGTLGSGNHYLEIQAVAEIFDPSVAKSLRDRAG